MLPFVIGVILNKWNGVFLPHRYRLTDAGVWVVKTGVFQNPAKTGMSEALLFEWEDVSDIGFSYRKVYVCNALPETNTFFKLPKWILHRYSRIPVFLPARNAVDVVELIISFYKNKPAREDRTGGCGPRSKWRIKFEEEKTK